MEELHSWFLIHRRSFPWRERRGPYSVWISEVMLQQTRACVVIPYFQRWMAQFPTVEALAGASIEKVIKAWEGLGYYSRARNLHAAARQIMERFDGILPSSPIELATLPGLGPYTIGAIVSFGFQKRAVAVDGNVARVISRYYAIEERIDRLHIRRTIEEKVEALLDLEKPWITMEALIELGALVCGPQPQCDVCPLRASCKGLAKEMASSLPIKKGREPTILLKRWVTVIESSGQLLVQKGDKGKVMADLYEFPYFEKGEMLEKVIFRKFGCAVRLKRRLSEVVHTFTRYKARLIPLLFQAQSSADIQGWDWIDKEKLIEFPFSAGHRAILQEIIR